MSISSHSHHVFRHFLRDLLPMNRKAAPPYRKGWSVQMEVVKVMRGQFQLQWLLYSQPPAVLGGALWGVLHVPYQPSGPQLQCLARQAMFRLVQFRRTPQLAELCHVQLPTQPWPAPQVLVGGQSGNQIPGHPTGGPTRCVERLLPVRQGRTRRDKSKRSPPLDLSQQPVRLKSTSPMFITSLPKSQKLSRRWRRRPSALCPVRTSRKINECLARSGGKMPGRRGRPDRRASDRRLRRKS